VADKQDRHSWRHPFCLPRSDDFRDRHRTSLLRMRDHVIGKAPIRVIGPLGDVRRYGEEKTRGNFPRPEALSDAEIAAPIVVARIEGARRIAARAEVVHALSPPAVHICGRFSRSARPTSIPRRRAPPDGAQGRPGASNNPEKAPRRVRRRCGPQRKRTRGGLGKFGRRR
jgi:hypothetical protein